MYKNIFLKRVAKSDCTLLFHWANDESVIENSFNSKKITYDEHVSWFNAKLKAKDSSMFIIQDNNENVGVIRLDKLDTNSLLISFSISSAHRGKGYATALLKYIKAMYPQYLLIGKVKAINLPSIKAFTKAGYTMKDENGIKVFYSR